MLADLPPPLPTGSSVLGRPLTVSCRGAADAPRTALVVGQLHGDEPHAPLVVGAVRRERVPAGLRLCSIRSLNPDGAARGTRTNARGVDLNRNFPGSWRPGARDRFHPGPRAASEPETRWFMRVVRALDPDLTVHVHQPYGLVHLTPGADRALVRAYARRVRLPARTLPAYRGTATGWQHRRDPKASAFVVELPAGRPGAGVPARHARAIIAAARAR